MSGLEKKVKKGVWEVLESLERFDEMMKRLKPYLPEPAPYHEPERKDYEIEITRN